MRHSRLAGIVAVGVMVVGLAACGGSSGSDAGPGGDGSADGGGGETTLTFAGWGGTTQEAQTRAWLDPFMEEHPNVKILQDSPNDYAKIKAMVDSGNVTWDVVAVGGDFGLASSQTELLEPIDCDVVACADLRPDELLTTGYRVAETLLAVVLGYNTEVLGDKVPQDWADVFNVTDFPGKRALWKWSGSGVIEAALLADGVQPDDLYPLDVERALKKIESISDDVIWFDSPAQCAQLLSDGEASMAMCPNSRIYTAEQDGAPVAIQWNQALLTADYFVIPKGSKHVDEAMELIAYITSPEPNAALSYELPLGPTNAKSESMVNPDNADQVPSSHADEGVFQDDQWYADNGADLDQRFQEWVQGL